MFNSDTERKRETERKCFRKVIETVQELGRQGIPFQGDEGNDNFSRILLLRGKDDPEVAKRVLTNTDPKFINTPMISIKTSLWTSWQGMCYV